MPQAQDESNLSITRKRLIFRSWHRGTREIDLLLGKFADAHVPSLSAAQLTQYDRFLSNSDPDIYNWITGQEPLPPSEENEVTVLLLGFFKSPAAGGL